MQIVLFPLFVLFLLEVVVCVALTSPATAIRLFMTNRVKALGTTPASRSVFATLAGVIFILFTSAFITILRSQKEDREEADAHGHLHHKGGRREAEILEAYLLALLSGASLVLAGTSRALAARIDEARRLDISLGLLKRQAESNMKELERISAAGGVAGVAGAAGAKDAKDKAGDAESDKKRLAELSARVEQLEKEKAEGDKAKATAERDLAVMKKQSESLAREFDRVADENAALERKLRLLEGGAGAGGAGKKGD